MKIIHWLPLITVAFLFAGCAGGGAPASDLPGNPTGRVAFVNRVGQVNHLFIMDVGADGIGTNLLRITSDPETEDYPAWSPDGRMLLYHRGLDGSGIYLINVDGTDKKRLSSTPGFDVFANFSPDAKQIVYTHLHGPPQPGSVPQTDIRVMNVDGTDDHAILQNVRLAVEPHWSTQGKIVFMSLMAGSGLDIYTMNPDGSSLQRITTNGALGLNNGDPKWSADGAKITFGSDREGGDRLNIFKMNPDGTNVEQLTHFNPPYEAGDTNWSSDNRKITFQYDISGKKQSDPDAYAEVWTMNADGSGAKSTKIPCANVGGGRPDGNRGDA